MSGVTGAANVAGGRYHSLVVLSTGTVKATGYNGSGQLGDGSFTQRTRPVAVSTLTNAIAIATAYDHAVALTSGGAAYGWGTTPRGSSATAPRPIVARRS